MIVMALRAEEHEPLPYRRLPSSVVRRRFVAIDKKGGIVTGHERKLDA
jgi:hypothetical protein